MNSSGKTLKRKILVAALAVAMVGGIGALTPAVSNDVSGMVVSAADVQVTPSGLEYQIGSSGAKITGYAGDSEIVLIPSEIDGYTVNEIADYAFKSNTFITYVDMPSSIKTIGYSAFEDCTALKNVSFMEGITSILSDAFKGCKSLQELGLPKTLKNIGDSAFEGCINLSAVKFNSEMDNFGEVKGVKVIGNNAFNKTKIVELVLPESLESIGNYAFANNTFMTSADIYGGSIGYNAFENCTALKKLFLLEGVSDISSDAFKGCKSLEGVSFPKTVENIGDYAFSGCISLASAEFHCDINQFNEAKGIKYIGSNAFEGTKIKELSLPESIESISSYAFANNTVLSDVYIYNGSISCNAFENCTALKTLILGGGVADISSSAFKGCKSLTSVYFPETVETIGDSAFEGCISLASVTFYSHTNQFGETQGIKNIGTDAFKGAKIKTLSLPKSLESIGSYAFNGNAVLTSVSISSGSISWNVFENCTALTKLTLGEGVTNISSSAFRGCKSLSAVTFPKTLEKIGDSAFDGCVSLNSAVFKSETNQFNETQGIKYIGTYAFKGAKIKTLSLPKSFEDLGSYAFNGNTFLTSVSIPSGSISWNTFEGCTSLKTLTLGDGVTNISSSAFKDCKSLTKVSFPKSIENIGDSAFSGCTSLDSVKFCYATDKFGESFGVANIGSSAFDNCLSLKTVFVPHTVANIGNYAFSNVKIVAKKDTEAAEYAQKNDLTYSSTLTNYSTVSATTVTAGTEIKLDAMAVGGSGDYKYALMYKKSSSNTWIKIGTKYGLASTGSFTPKSATKYDVMINVKDGNGTVKSKTFTIDVKAPLANKTTISAATVKAGEKVVLKGAASGGSGTYTYAFYYKKNSSTKWTEMQPAFTTKSAAFKPGSATTYNVKVVVKDSDGNKAYSTFDVKVTK